jgi:hypothetical protein
MEVIEATQQLTELQWPDATFPSVSDILTRVECDEDNQYYCPPYQPDTEFQITAAGLMLSLKGISRSNKGVCKLVNLLYQHQKKLTDILENGSKSDNRATRELLMHLANHNCGQCTDVEWIKELLLTWEMTVSKFLDELQQIMDQPQGQLDKLIRLLDHNEDWIESNGREVGDAVIDRDMPGLYALVKFCQDKTRLQPPMTEPRQAVFSLYDTLYELTHESEQLRELLCQNQVLRLIAQHLTHIQSAYMDDEVHM